MMIYMLDRAEKQRRGVPQTTRFDADVQEQWHRFLMTTKREHAFTLSAVLRLFLRDGIEAAEARLRTDRWELQPPAASPHAAQRAAGELFDGAKRDAETQRRKRGTNRRG
jgi:hypothetical protein